MPSDPGNVLDILMQVLEREATRLRDDHPGPLSTFELDVVVKMTAAVQRVEVAMRNPVQPPKLAKLTDRELRDKIRELELARAAS
jgi:hypothetical protein